MEAIVKVPGVGEILIDNLHIYATDIIMHRLIKMDMTGTVIASTGTHGVVILDSSTFPMASDSAKTMKSMCVTQTITESKYSIKI